MCFQVINKVTCLQIKMHKIYCSILAILYITNLPGTEGEVKIQSRTLQFPGKELIFGSESYEDGKLTYAICDKIGESSERKCKLLREKVSYSNDTYVCDVTLKLDHRQGVSGADEDQISVIPFGKNKAIVRQSEKGENANVKISTINLEDCKVTDNEISVTNPLQNPLYSVSITPFENSYDVVYKNSDTCGMKGHCKISVDAFGKIVDGPANTTQAMVFLTYFPYVAAIDPKSPEKGTFHIEFVNVTFKEFFIHKPDGRCTKIISS